MQFLTRARDRATTLSRIAAWSGVISERGWGFWAAELKGTSELIGFIGLSGPLTSNVIGYDQRSCGRGNGGNC